MTLLAGFVEGREIGLQDVSHAKAVTAGLIGISGADALERGADLGLSHSAFAGGIQGAVGGQDQVGALGNEQLSAHIHSPSLDGGDFFHQDNGVYDHAVTDHIHRSLAEDAGRHGVEHEAVSVEHQRMAGVGTALETGYNLVRGRQDIYDLTFALVPPLEAEHNV